MNDENRPHHRCGHRRYKHRRGASSFQMHDPGVVFGELKLKEGDCFLDLGCGTGDYAIQAAKIIGDSGKVFALDIWKNLIDDLTEKADSQGLTNVKALASDITWPLPIEDNCVDVCLMATVLHTLDIAGDGKALFNEIRRVLKPDGRVAIIECKKEDMPFGPPLHMRLSADELEDSIVQYGFDKIGVVDLGYNYMIHLGVK